MENQTELTVINPVEYGLEPTKAKEMTSGLNSIIEERNALEKIYNDIILKELNQDTLKEARELRLKIQKNRTTGIEAWHKTNKAFYLAGGRFVDAYKNREIIINERMEAKLDEIENHFKNLENERLNKLEADRKEKLSVFGEVNPFVDLKKMDDETFDKYYATEKLAFDTKIEQEKKAELDRIEAERVAEEKRLADLKAEQDRIEAQRLENERLKKEAEAKEKELEAERKKQAEIQAKKDAEAKAEQDRLAKIAEEEKAKADKLEAELKAKKEAEDLAIQKEKERIEAEEAEKLAKEKALANAGDREKVKRFFETFKTISFPELSSEDGAKLSKEINEGLALLRQVIINGSKKLV